MQLVSLTEFVPAAIIDLRYAGSNNVVGQPLYSDPKPQLERVVAEALQKVTAELAKQALQLVIWDAYRPAEVQKRLQKVNDDPAYVTEASKHSEGLAVDVTLADNRGNYLDMGTDFDDFSAAARPNAPSLTEQQAANQAILVKTMQQFGFRQWPTEWWHFEYTPVYLI